MKFEAKSDTTLDNSIPIIVWHKSKNTEEYIFQFALNKKEILQLQKELKKALKIIEERE
jgi:hypothetical protein